MVGRFVEENVGMNVGSPELGPTVGTIDIVGRSGVSIGFPLSTALGITVAASVDVSKWDGVAES
jgi:hypothetical protein